MNKYRDFDNYLKEHPTADGYFGRYGGNYLKDPELIKAFNEYAEGYHTIAQSAQFIAELRRIRRDFQGRPTPVYHCQNLSNALGRTQIYLKREDLNHTGAHKLNHCMGEGLLAKYMGKKKLIAETGAGQHGVALATAAGPHPFPLMVRDFQFCIGEEARAQFLEQTGHLPDQVVACVGGGSNSIGMFTPFLADPVELVGVEPLGRGPALGDHAASITYGTEGVMHGFNSIMLADENGDPAPVYSNASGLDYPAAGPEHAMLHDMDRVKYVTAGDDDAIEALFLLCRHEGIIPAIESSHALAYAIRVARTGMTGSVLVSLSGRGDKDLDYVVEHYGYGPEFLEKMAAKRGK